LSVWLEPTSFDSADLVDIPRADHPAILAKWRREILLNGITSLVGTETNLLSKRSLPAALAARLAFRPDYLDRTTIIDKFPGGQNQLPFARRRRFSS
jgi:hypothetical protein